MPRSNRMAVSDGIRRVIGRALLWFIAPIMDERARKRLESLRSLALLTSTSEEERCE